MELSEPLLPCPFCSGQAEVERFGTPKQSTIYVCTDCGCKLETGEEWGFGREWNKRYNMKGEKVDGQRTDTGTDPTVE